MKIENVFIVLVWVPTHPLSPDMVLDQHEVSGPVGQDARKRIREALLKQHHHQNHKKLANRIPIVRSFADIGKKQSEPHSMDKNGKKTHSHFLSKCVCTVRDVPQFGGHSSERVQYKEG